MTRDLNKKNQWVNSQNRSIEGNKRIPLGPVFYGSSCLYFLLEVPCSRLEVGATLVKDRRIIAGGYNGSVSGDVHCIDRRLLCG